MPSYSPLATSEVGLVDPCLIEVDHSHPSAEFVKHELGIELTQNHASVCVAKVWDSLDWLVPRSNVVSENSSNVT